MTAGWNRADLEEQRPSRLLRLTLSGASLVIVLFLVLAAVVEDRTRSFLTRVDEGAVLDPAATGSIKAERGRVYTIHRSVLQSSRDAVCVIEAGGSRHGDC